MIENVLSFKHLSTNCICSEHIHAKINDVVTSGVNLNLILVFLQAEVFAELGEVLNGSRPALRNKTTVFKSLGKFFPLRTDQIRVKETFRQFLTSSQNSN